MAIAVTHRFRATRGKGKDEWNDTHVVTGDPDGINVLSFGAVGDGVTDDTAAIQAAITATPVGGCIYFPLPTMSYVLSQTLAITKAITIEFGHVAAYTTINVSDTTTPTFLWAGGASPMVSVTNVGGVQFVGSAVFDCQGVATYGLYGDRMRESQWRGKLLVYNPATAGVCLYTSLGTANDNSMFNSFDEVYVLGPKGLVLDSANPTLANCCHNRFGRLRIDYTGDDAIDLVACDNNLFEAVFLYRRSGAGYGLRLHQYAYNNYFLHFQGPLGIPPGIGTSVLVDAACTNASTIFGYDMTNGQALPTIEAGGAIAFFSQGTGSYGDWTPRHILMGDSMTHSLNSEAQSLEDYTIGHKIKWVLNQSARTFDVYKDESGAGYQQLLALSLGGVTVYRTVAVKGEFSTEYTNGQVTSCKTVDVLSPALSGATATFTKIIPANTLVFAVTVHAITPITSADGGTEYQCGDGTDVDRWGDSVQFAWDVNVSLYTIPSPVYYLVDTDVVLTCKGGKTFSGGTVRVTVHYMRFWCGTT